MPCMVLDVVTEEIEAEMFCEERMSTFSSGCCAAAVAGDTTCCS